MSKNKNTKIVDSHEFINNNKSACAKCRYRNKCDGEYITIGSYKEEVTFATCLEECI